MRHLFLLLAWMASAPAWGESGPDDYARLVILLDDADLSVAGEAANALGQGGAAAFPVLREALASGSTQQRWGAAVALFRSTADPEPLLPDLTRQLSQQDEGLIRASLGALARLRGKAGEPGFGTPFDFPETEAL